MEWSTIIWYKWYLTLWAFPCYIAGMVSNVWMLTFWPFLTLSPYSRNDEQLMDTSDLWWPFPVVKQECSTIVECKFYEHDDRDHPHTFSIILISYCSCFYHWYKYALQIVHDYHTICWILFSMCYLMCHYFCTSRGWLQVSRCCLVFQYLYFTCFW